MLYENSDSIKITKILVDGELDSYFEEVEIATDDLRPLGKYSKGYEGREIYFRNSIEGVYDFHPAPSKQYIIYL